MDRQELHRQIDHIFNDLLPAAGMTKRAEQTALTHRLLDAMLDGKIMLCDAGTGIGKTFAYLVAGILFLRYCSSKHIKFRPIIVSTSNITLQTELHQKYIPQLADILLADGWNLNRTALSVIRKGKSHYVCEQRLERRLREISQRSSQRRERLRELRTELDMDMAGDISGYDQKLLQIPRICHCDRTQCRYQKFLEDCAVTPYLFQICNHNLFLADAISRHHRYRPLFPDYCAAVIDEAHKLPETAKDMLELTFDGEEIRAFVQRLKRSRYLLAAEYLADAAQPLLRELDASPGNMPFQHYTHLLIPVEKMLRRIRNTLGNYLFPAVREQLDSIASKTSFICGADEGEYILCTEKTDGNHTLLKVVRPDLSGHLQEILWKPARPVLLLSGTLAIGKNFTSFRKAAGLLDFWRTEESVFQSPFDYQHNCMLYFPLTPPTSDSKRFYKKLADEIERLLRAADGHALVLFTSYAQLTDTKKALEKRKLPWHIYATNGNAAYTVDQFRKDPGSILLGTGPLWEGVDFPGDCVSLLIIPHLPFPYPDAVSEYERKKHDTFHSYIEAVPLPEMQIKLRQGFGRAIRTETDTCVVAILDERGVPGGRYYHDVINTLPTMRKTRSIFDIEQFIRNVKPDSYFLKHRKPPCV